MKKEMIYSLCKDRDTCGEYVEPMEGYIDESIQVAYVNTHDEGDGKWVSVCLITGLTLFYRKTRKELEKKTKSSLELIEKVRNNPSMEKYINEYKKVKRRI